MKYVYQQLTNIVDTNLTDTYPEWNPSTTYIFESGTPTSSSIVRYGTFYYRSVVDGNIGNNPEDTENVKWTKYGISNKYAMLDMSSNTKSFVEDGNLWVKFSQTDIGTIGFGNFEAGKIVVELINNSDEILWSYDTGYFYNETVVDYYTYMYDGYVYEIDRGMIIDLPIKTDYVKITFYSASPEVRTAVGYIVGGDSVNMGKTLNNVKFSFNSFALKETDDWGALTVTKRAVQDLVDFETVIDTQYLPTFKRNVKHIYNDIIMFVVDDTEDSQFENILVLGVIQDASVVLTEFDKTIISFSVMESV